MAYFEVACELLEIETAAIGQEPAVDVSLTDEDANVDVLVERGLLDRAANQVRDLIPTHARVFVLTQPPGSQLINIDTKSSAAVQGEENKKPQ